MQPPQEPGSIEDAEELDSAVSFKYFHLRGELTYVSL